MKNKLMIVIPVLAWLIIGIYGIGYNITYIDEAKYLIKGWLMVTGQVGYYATPEFFYQHMPGGLLWYGLGQKIFGPSLLAARIQSFLIGLLVMFFSYKLAGLINPKAKKNILAILSLGPVAILYYSSAVPQSLSALSLVIGFYWLFKNRYRLATVSFCASFLIRENFLFTLIIYLLFLVVELRKNIKELAINLLITLITLGIVFIPGWPGILNVLKNFPGVSMLLPISAAERAVLGINWMKPTHSWQLYFQAVKEFGGIYFSFLIVGLMALVKGWRQKKLWPKDNRWRLLIVIAGFNFLAHTWSAFNLTPRAIVSYLVYIFPLLAVIFSTRLKKIPHYWLLLLIALIGLNFASLFQKPGQQNTISVLNQSAKELKPIINKQKIIWLAEPMSLYLAGKVSYYPLINHTNLYKPSQDTKTVKKLGFWNQSMMKQWLDEAELVVVDPNRTALLEQSQLGKDLALMIKSELEQNFQLIETPDQVWPAGLIFYQSRR